MTLLDESQLDALLDKLSGFAKAEERILVLARYHHLKPASFGEGGDPLAQATA